MKPSLAKRLWACLTLSVIFLRELARSSVSVAAAAFAPQPNFSPAIIAMPLRVRTDMGITMLANLISLTPGTTSLHVSEDRSLLYLHCLDAASEEAVIADIRATFEDRIRAIEG